MDKDRIQKLKFIIAIFIIVLVVAFVIFRIIKYQTEGEKNMPFNLSKIIVVSTAQKEDISQENEQNNIWNFNIIQTNDVYISIERNKNNTKKDEKIKNISINNIEVTESPAVGVLKPYMPNSLEGRTFTYDTSYLVENGLEYKGGKTSNPKTLEICNQGGSAVIRFANTNVGNFVSNDDTEVQHNGTLLTKIGTTEEETKFQVNFDFIIQANKIKYKTNITLSLPCENLLTEGTSNKEITDMSGIVFKRIK